MKNRPDAPESHYERRRRAVHERILSAATDRFEQVGIESARIDDICAAAGIAQKTFFNHFPTKQHLVRELGGMFLRQVVETVEHAQDMADTTAGRLEHLFEHVAAAAADVPPTRRALSLELIRLLHGDSSQAELAGILRKSFADLLRHGVREGDVTGAHPIPVLSQVVAGSFYSLMLDWISIDGFPIRARARGMAKFLADALAPGAAATRRHARGSRRE